MEAYPWRKEGGLAMTGDIKSKATIKEEETGSSGIGEAYEAVLADPTEENKRRVRQAISDLNVWLVRS